VDTREPVGNLAEGVELGEADRKVVAQAPHPLSQPTPRCGEVSFAQRARGRVDARVLGHDVSNPAKEHGIENSLERRKIPERQVPQRSRRGRSDSGASRGLEAAATLVASVAVSGCDEAPAHARVDHQEA
jgi:hypothetical protein